MLVVYGVLCIVMGLQAFFFPFNAEHKPSPMSLVGGVGAGMVLLMAVWLTFKNEKGGYIMALCVCGLLLAQFGRGLATDYFTGRPLVVYPKGINVALALLVAGALGVAHFQNQARLKGGSRADG
jgi:uncharacterized membrane protein (UPF0136 family)